MPTQIRVQLSPPETAADVPGTGNLFGDQAMAPHERRILGLLKKDEATQIDVIVEKLEPELSSSEIFAALFELELAGKVRQLPGKNFVKAF